MVSTWIAVAAVIASASQSGWAQAAGTSRWSFVIEQRYGDRPGTELANPQTIAVDGAGRLYVADGRPAAVKVFNQDGTLLRVIGREGGGPGENRNPWIAARGGVVVVHDPAQSRTSVFDTSGKVLRSWSSFCCHQNEVFVDRAMRIVVPAVTPSVSSPQSQGIRSTPYVRFDVNGRVVDTITIRASGDERLWTVPRRGSDGKPGSGTTSVTVPFTPRQHFAWHADGGYVSGWSAALQLYRSTNGSDSTPLTSVRRIGARIPEELRRAQADSAVEQFSRMVDPVTARAAVHLDDVPSTAPEFTRLLIDDDGNIWARQLVGGDRNTTAFRIFDRTGKELGRMILPVRVPEWGGVAYGHGTVFVRTEDSDGQPIVVRVRVSRTS